MNKILNLLATILVLLSAIGCSDKEIADSYVKGRIEMDGDIRVTVLHLGNRDLCAADIADIDALKFTLEAPSQQQRLTFGGKLLLDNMQVLGSSDALTCRINLGDTDIPDGSYYLSVSGEGLPDIGMRRVMFEGNVGAEYRAESMSYDDLDGSGTSADPYLINDDGDFLTLLWYLQEDPDHAYGKYFRQTSSFDVPRRSQMIDGHVWLPSVFSGHYDGGGNELRSLAYQGSTDPGSDSSIGLFEHLYSAEIKNLSLTGALLINVCNETGLIAGSCSGDCTFENITLGGTISFKGHDVGGLVGKSSGNTTAKNIRVNSLVISGADSQDQGTRIGLLTGFHSGGDLTVDGFSTPDHVFSVTGHDHIGGLVGHIDTGGKVSLKSVSIEHSVDQESAGVKVIYGTDAYVGGVVGMLTGNGEALLESVNVKAPVRGRQDIGAMTGHAKIQNLKVVGAMLTSVVSGEMTIGGLFGYLGFPGNGAQVTLDCSKPIRYVVKSSAEAGVSGGKHVGGLAGYFDCNHGAMKIDNGKVEIAVNVKGSETVGGVFGYANKLGDFNPYLINFSSATMRVEATGNNAGGIVGNAANSTIAGSIRLNPLDKIPSASSLASCYSGVVIAGNNAGGVAGTFSGTITGVSSTASVTSTSGVAGGISGYIDNNINNSTFAGEVTGKSCAGGMFGQALRDLYMHDCINYGTVRADRYAAGIAACAVISDGKRFYIKACYNSGHITGACVAGVAAYIGTAHERANTDFTIINCGNSGRIEGTGNKDESVGGVVATFDHYEPEVISCANHGKVTGGEQYAIGGVVGEFGRRSGENFGEVEKCMNSGEVSSSHESTHVGGICGHLHSNDDFQFKCILRDCYNTGSIPSDQKSDNGGILGYAANGTNTYRTFNRGKVSHGNAIIGTHHSGSIFHHSHNYFLEGTGGDWPSSTKVPSDKVGNKDTYETFDFNNVWSITGAGPVLRDCPFQ